MTDKTRAAVTHWINTAVMLVGVLVADNVIPNADEWWGKALTVIVAAGAAFGIDVAHGDKTAQVGGRK